jgi:hypothetical protein
MPHGSAGIDDVGNVSFPLGRFRPQQRFARACKYFGGIILVEKGRTHGIFADRADAMRQQQPAFVKDTLCYPIAAGHLSKERIRQYRLLEYLSFIRFAELPTPTLARRWDSRA